MKKKVRNILAIGLYVTGQGEHGGTVVERWTPEQEVGGGGG